MNEIRIVIEGLNELTEAVRRLAGLMPVQENNREQAGKEWGQAPGMPAGAPAGTGMPVPVSQGAPVPQGAPVSQGMSVPQGAPVSQGMPVPQQAGGGQVPVTAAPREYTLEQLQVAAAGLTSSGKMPQVMGILRGFGIQAMTELRKEQYGAFAAALREAGAQI